MYNDDNNSVIASSCLNVSILAGCRLVSVQSRAWLIVAARSDDIAAHFKGFRIFDIRLMGGFGFVEFDTPRVSSSLHC